MPKHRKRHSPEQIMRKLRDGETNLNAGPGADGGVAPRRLAREFEAGAGVPAAIARWDDYIADLFQLHLAVAAPNPAEVYMPSRVDVA